MSKGTRPKSPEQLKALCCECGMRRTTAWRHPSVGGELKTIGLRMLVRRKCANCGTITNHAVIRPDDDEYRDYAETPKGHRPPSWGWCGTLEDQAEMLDRIATGAAEFLTEADRHGQWRRGRYQGSPDEVESELWNLGVRLRAAEDESDKDKDTGDYRRCTGRYEWWADLGEMIVTPDLRATDREIVILLRSVQRFLEDDKYRAQWKLDSTEDGPFLSLSHFTDRPVEVADADAMRKAAKE